MSMAVGEYVSVSSQRDAEHGDIAREQRELTAIPDVELDELTSIYVGRGLEPALARQVAEQLTAHDALKAHLRDELNIDATALAKPLQAAWISALSFAAFAMVPVGALLAAPLAWALPTIAAASIVSLMILGAIGGVLGGANPLRAAIRVAVGGSLAMGITAGIGRLMGVAVS
jgi:VIT1/CCC1 family predicted Fe2+/Mn2+ transporter